jgi:hypothetical protein
VSDISPHARSEAEAQTNKRAGVILAGLIVIVACGQFWYFGAASDRKSASALNPTTHADGSNTPDDPRPPETDDGDDPWNHRIHGIKPVAHRDNGDQVVRALNQSLDRLSQHLSDHAVSLESDHGSAVAARIEELKRQSNPANDLGPRSPNEQELVSRIERKVELQRHQEQVEQQQAVDQAVAKVRDSRANELRDSRLALRDAEDSVANLRAQIARAERDLRHSREKAARAAALQRDMSVVRSLLSPFISHGHRQPRGVRNSMQTILTPEAMPVSLVRLERIGGLQPTMEGLKRLYTFGTATNKRPRGSFPAFGSGTLEKDRRVLNAVKQAQQLLQRHGQALVEARMLSP